MCVCVCASVCYSSYPIVLYLQVFFSNLEANRLLDPQLVRKGLKFRDNLTKRYNWDFASEPDEYAPTVVDTD